MKLSFINVTFLVILMTYALSLTTNANEQSRTLCNYDKQNYVLTDSRGFKTRIYFAIHALPSSIFKFWEDMAEAVDNKNQSLAVARKLLAINKKQSPEMVRLSNELLSHLRAKKISWIGVEVSQKHLNAIGVIARCKSSEANEKMFKQYGLSEAEIQQLMVNLDGSSVYAYCRWVNSFPEKSLSKVNDNAPFTREQAIENVKLIGIDNDRFEELDQLNSKIKKQENELDKILNSKMRRVKTDELDKLYLKKDGLMDKEIEIRDRGMSRDIYLSSSQFGSVFKTGVAVIGSFHEIGMRDILTNNCKNGVFLENENIQQASPKGQKQKNSR